MKKELFDELLESVREGGAILRGEREPSRRFTFEVPDVRDLREKHGLSQPKSAALIGISVGTLRNCEQGGVNRRVARECCCVSSNGTRRWCSRPRAALWKRRRAPRAKERATHQGTQPAADNKGAPRSDLSEE
jgi:putative transcriptional regulator